MAKSTSPVLYVAGPLALIFAAAGLAAFPLASDDALALGVLILVPAALLALYVVAQGVFGDRHFGALMAVIYIFVAAANFRIRAYDDKSVDLQVAAKLAAFSIVIATCCVFFSFALGRIRFPWIFYLWLAFFGGLIVCSLYAEKVSFSLTCSVLFLFSYLYAVYMTAWLSRRSAVQVMMGAALLICVGSIFVYFVIPSIGVMQAWTAEGGFGEIGRMKGLTGSANGIGFIAAFALVLSVLYFRSLGPSGRWTAFLLVPSAILCLALSANRSSMIAVVATIWFSFVFRRNAGPKVLLTIVLTLVGAAALALFPDEILATLSRSGKAGEITSATGRSSIWAVVLEMWAQRPLHGYGYTSALAILPLDPRLFHVAAHAHNMYLELLFAGGATLLALFLYATWQTLRQAHRLGAVKEAALLVFFLLRGLTEATPFSGMVGYSSLAFTVSLALIIAQSLRARTLHSTAAAGTPVSVQAAGATLRQSHP